MVVEVDVFAWYWRDEADAEEEDAWDDVNIILPLPRSRRRFFLASYL